MIRYERTTVTKLSQIIRLRLPKICPKNGMSCTRPRFTSGISGMLVGVPFSP